MKLISFPEQTVVIAEHQPEYEKLPAHMAKNDPNGTVTCCWRLNWRERILVLLRGVIWHQVLTFHTSLQPQRLSIDKPEMRKCFHDLVFTAGGEAHCRHCGHVPEALKGIPIV